MNKEGINNILLNSTFFIFIIYLLNRLNVLNNIIELLSLLTISIVLSYIIYPIYKKQKTIIFIISIIIFIIFLYYIFSNIHFIDNIIELFNNLMLFINKINTKYALNINIDLYLEKIINYLISNSIFLLKNIINYLGKILFIIILSICILLNNNYIKKIINKFKYYDLLINIDSKLRYYLIANLKIMLIQFIEYTLLFLIIGHSNYLLLGLLNSLNTFIPFIGSIFTNIIAIITASVISKKVLILTSLISIIMPQIDAYFITPKIYKESNEIPQTLYIMTMIILGSLFKLWGVILSLPILIIIIEIINYKNIVKNN